MCVMRDRQAAGGSMMNWSQRRRASKSAASEKREIEAKKLFDNELVRLAEIDEKTEKMAAGLIPPQVHLTAACWKDFKTYVLLKMCKVVRRVASDTEKIQHGVTMKSRCNRCKSLTSVYYNTH